MIIQSFKKNYPKILFACFLIPNVFVVTLGIESFPLTCAPMFGHYIDEETPLYVLKFEGVTNSETIDLVNYLGKPEDFFMRHFFSKVYGSTQAISPFTNKLSESNQDFQHRMNTFFKHYEQVLFKNYNLSFEQIQLKAVHVNQNRKPIGNPISLGFYNCETKTYKSAKNYTSISNSNERIK